MVSFLVYNANARISSVIASIFGDLVLEEAHKEGVIITQETADIAVRITDYICKWYKVDYAYIYIPDFENGTRTYIAASQREGISGEELENHLIGYTSKYEMTEGEKVLCTVSISDRIVIRFEDGGMPFDPSKNIISPDDYDIDTQIGGLGRFIAFSNADDVDYEYKNGKNILTLTKYFEEENKDDNNQN